MTEREAVARQLERWVAEVRSGGWSTQHVEPMLELAAALRASIVHEAEALRAADDLARAAEEYASSESDMPSHEETCAQFDRALDAYKALRK